MLLFGKNSGRVEYLNFYDIRVDDPENTYIQMIMMDL
jgi:hypothetical protein